MNFIGNVSRGGGAFPSFMFSENRIADGLAKCFGDRFSEPFKQYGSLAGVWREAPELNWDMTRSMLWASPYRQSYFLELCELARSHDKERTGKPFDELLASQKVDLEEKYARERDRNEIVDYELWTFVFVLVDMWARDACIRAKDEADRFDLVHTYSKSESERDAYMISIQYSFMQGQAKRLHELIHNPFLPKYVFSE